MQDVLKVLGMLKLPQEDGCLYLFPEYGDLENTLMDESLRNRDTIEPNSRVRYIIEPSDGTHYIAKEERDDKSNRRRDYKIPPYDRYNISLVEICIGRAQSQLIEFEDEISIISFEKAVGYYDDGRTRTAFFMYEEGPEITFCSLFPQFDKMTREIIRQKGQEQPENDKLRYTREYWQAIEIYRPHYLMELITNLNGITRIDEEYLMFNEKDRYRTFFCDFEHYRTDSTKENAELMIDHCLTYMTGSFQNTDRLELIGDDDIKDITELRKRLLSEIEQASPILSRRVENILKGTGYFEGKIQRFGPAYDIVKQIPILAPDALVIN